MRALESKLESVVKKDFLAQRKTKCTLSWHTREQTGQSNKAKQQGKATRQEKTARKVRANGNKDKTGNQDRIKDTGNHMTNLSGTSSTGGQTGGASRCKQGGGGRYCYARK